MKNPKYFKIDTHTHILPPEIPLFKEMFGYGGFIKLNMHENGKRADMMRDDGQFFRTIESNCWDPESRLEDCVHSRVDLQVLSTVPVMFSYHIKPQDGLKVASNINEHIAGLVEERPKSFVGLGTLPMQDMDLAVKELERCVKELGLRGVQIGSHINDMNLNDEKLFPFYEAAESLGAAVMVHPWDMMGKEKMSKYWLPWLVGMPAETSLAICSMIFGGVFEKFPQMRTMFAHGGGSFPATIGRIEHGFNVRPDLCAIDNNKNPREYLGKFYLDSITHDQTMLKYIVDLVGVDKVILGTDYPFPLGELEPGKLIEETNFTPEAKEKLLATNALDWLGLNREDYL